MDEKSQILTMRKTINQIKLRFPIFINVVFSLVLFVHVAFIGYGIKYPAHPSTKMYQKPLHELKEFPVTFQICVKEKNNSHSRYIRLGYEDIWSFYKGVPYFDGVLVGWAGHDEYNSTISSVKGINF